jgi:hypothetical protein
MVDNEGNRQRFECQRLGSDCRSVHQALTRRHAMVLMPGAAQWFAAAQRKGD